MSFRYLGPGEQIDPDYDPNNARSSYESSTLNVAPFWPSGQATGETVNGLPTTKYGEITYQGRKALCINWSGVAPANTCISGAPIDWSKTNDFQLLIVDRSDRGYEDVDLVYNYGSIEWDQSGPCHGASGAGYSLDTPGSGSVISGSWTLGALLDSNTSTGLIYRSQGSTQLGRFVFEIANGLTAPSVPPGGTNGSPDDPDIGENPTNGAGEPVNTATGSYYTSITDLSLAGIGVPFNFERSYNSGDATTGPLGPGWTHSLNASLAVQPNGDVIARSEQGQQIYFTKNPDGTFAAPGMARASLASVSGGYELVTNEQLHYRFDTSGRLTSEKDRNGQGLTLSYNPDSTLATVVDSGNRTVTFTHSAGRLTQVALPDGRRVDYTYDPIGRLQTVTDARGNPTNYTYDTAGRLKKVIDQNNHTVVDNTYGVDGRVAQQLDARNNLSTFQWDPVTQTATFTDPRLNQWKDVYQSNVLVERVDSLGKRTFYRYDAQLNLTDVIDPRGNASMMTYDARGNMLTRTAPAPLNYKETFTYTALNDVATYKDGRNNTTTYGYDTAGNLTSIARPDPDGGGPLPQDPPTLFGRDPAGTGLLASVTDARVKTTTFAHDVQGNLTSITTPLNKTTTMCYDGSGRLIGVVDPRGVQTCADPNPYKTTYVYDNADHLLTQTDPLNSATNSVFDPAGNVTSVTDANNRTIGYGYDEANHLTSVTAPAPDLAQTIYGYDEVGNLTSRRDANTHTTFYQYDPANRLTSVTTPGGRLWSYAYDANGNRTQTVDANGNATPTAGDGTTTHAYDALNRLTGISYSESTSNVILQYDANGNRTSMNDAQATIETYVYDALNRVTILTRGGPNAFTYKYDAVDNITERTYPGLTAATYAYNDDGRLQSATRSSLTTTYGYDDAGNLTTTTLPSGNGYIETRTYDRAGRLTAVKNQKGVTVLSEFTVTPDPVGNPLSVVQTGVTPSTTNYLYDVRDRLTEVCSQASPCSSGSSPFIRWAYDPVGNRQTETRPSGTTTYGYDIDDRLLAAGATSYAYDNNGNQTQAGSRTFTWDLANRLKTTTLGNTTTTYTYDGDSKRLKASTGTQASKTTNSLWDTLMPVPQLALERDGNNNLLRQHLYGARRVSMTTSNGNAYYYHHDQLGSVANLTSATGASQWTYAYDPFGATKTETKNNNQAPTNLIKYAGEHQDPTGLYHLRARQYDPSNGRFLARDPVASSPKAPYASDYGYVNNRPTLLRDPTGLAWCSPLCPVVDTLEAGAEIVGGFVAEHDVDVYLAVGSIGCAAGAVATVGVVGGVCVVVGAGAFGSGIARVAVESGLVGAKPANYCRFGLSTLGSFGVFRATRLLNRKLWVGPYVLGKNDQRILRGTTESGGEGLERLGNEGFESLCGDSRSLGESGKYDPRS